MNRQRPPIARTKPTLFVGIDVVLLTPEWKYRSKTFSTILWVIRNSWIGFFV